MGKRNPIMLEDAQARLDKMEFCLKTERIRAEEALGRVCAQDIRAQMDQPPFPRSPLDGYAVRSRDISEASGESPVKLKVIEHIYAGLFPSRCIQAGEAARIMTGAPIPEGADCIIMQEKTDEGEERVEIYDSVPAFGNYCFKGEDTETGAFLFGQGMELKAAHIGILFSQGIREIEVYRRPVIGIMATGDELTEADKKLLPGKIYDSNGPLLAARIKELGMEPRLFSQGQDNEYVLAERVGAALKECDALITSGGVSVGARDCMPETAQILGAHILFHGINIRPGSPMMVMTAGGKPVFCLSGNPFAAAATFEVLVRPVLERMRGRSDWKPEIYKGILETPFPKPSPLRRLVRAKIEDGRIWLPEGKHSSGMLVSMAQCNCLVDIPAGSQKLEAGAMVSVIRM